MKDLLITHVDLDGISPIILLNLTDREFDYKSVEINEIEDLFKELFENNTLQNYENIYITDLTIPKSIYETLKDMNLNIKVFDHHETHLYANEYNFVNVSTHLFDRQTCGTELFYEYLKTKYPKLKNNNVYEYVQYVRELDTYNFTSDIPKQLDGLKETFGKVDFISIMTKRLKKDKEHFEFTAFEKRMMKLKTKEVTRYLQKMEKRMFKCLVDNKKCGVVFAETNKSELGNYLSSKYPELDLIILIDASSRISYRTCRDDVRVNDFAEIYGGGGHPEASGSRFDDDNRFNIITSYFKDVKRLEDTEN